MASTEAESSLEIEADESTSKNEVVFQTFGLKRYYPVTAGALKRRVGDVKAVDGVDLEIRRGKTQGLVGESGCGKSTLARLLSRLDEPTAGHIYFDLPEDDADEVAELENLGQDRTGEQDRRLEELREEYEINTMGDRKRRSFRRNVQFVFQNPTSSLNPKKLIRTIVSHPLSVHANLSPDEQEERVVSLLEEVGLGEDFLYRYPHQLSGGQKQRVAIARAIALNPECVILDEPTSALDVSVQAQILNLLEELQDKLDLTYLFITHDLGVIRHVADDISVMYLGNIVEEASRSDLFGSPKHPYTEALISSSPAVATDRRIRLEGDVPDPEDPPTGCPFHARCHKVEDFCGWSGRDLEALLRNRAEEDETAGRLYDALTGTAFDGYSAEFEFDESVGRDEAARALRGDVESLRVERPALFEAITDVSEHEGGVHVEFRDIPVPRLLEDDPDHFVACHLYDDTVN